MQALGGAANLQCPLKPRLQLYRDLLLAPQGRVQEAPPGEAHQGGQGGQLKPDRAERPEGQPGEGQEVRRRRSEVHSDSGLVAEHRVRTHVTLRSKALKTISQG